MSLGICKPSELQGMLPISWYPYQRAAFHWQPEIELMPIEEKEDMG